MTIRKCHCGKTFQVSVKYRQHCSIECRLEKKRISKRTTKYRTQTRERRWVRWESDPLYRELLRSYRRKPEYKAKQKEWADANRDRINARERNRWATDAAHREKMMIKTRRQHRRRAAILAAFKHLNMIPTGATP